MTMTFACIVSCYMIYEYGVERREYYIILCMWRVLCIIICMWRVTSLEQQLGMSIGLVKRCLDTHNTVIELPKLMNYHTHSGRVLAQCPSTVSWHSVPARSMCCSFYCVVMICVLPGYCCLATISHRRRLDDTPRSL